MTYTMSPMNQKFFTGFFTTWPARYANKVKANWLYVLPGVVFGVGIYQYGNIGFHNEHVHHRP